MDLRHCGLNEDREQEDIFPTLFNKKRRKCNCRGVVLNLGWRRDFVLLPQRTFATSETLLVVSGGCSWHLVDIGQRCC